MSNSIPCSSSTTIDDLPEPLLIHILSFLYIKDAIQTSRLSSKFRNLWHLIPSLNFDVAEYYDRSKSPHPRTLEALRNFAEFVYHTLFVRKRNPLTKFVLNFEFVDFEDEIHPRYEHYVQNWVSYAIGLSVTELVLDFDYRNIRWEQIEDERYGEWLNTNFMFCLIDLCGSCVKVLKLNKCDIILPESNHVKFVYLKSVEICSTICLCGEDICDLVARCVNLETLKLRDMNEYGPFGDLVIYSASIKEVYLEDIRGTRLDIHCRSLQKISLIRTEYEKYTIMDTTMLVKVCVDFNFGFQQDDNHWEKLLSCFTNVSSLRAWDELLESDEVPVGCEQFTSNVKHLELHCAFNEKDLVGLAALLKVLPNLEVLWLHNRKIHMPLICGAIKDVKLPKHYRRASTAFKMPCLRKVILRKYYKTTCERHFIKLFRKNGVVLENIMLLHFQHGRGS